MTAIPLFNLGKYLQEHGLTAYALVKEVEGQVPASTVYGLARKPAQRIDLPTVYTLLDALERLRGKKVELGEVVERLERQANASPKPSATAPNLDKTFRYSGSGKRLGLPSGTVSRLISEGREP
ncbi:MAG: hypothetical protein Q4C89_03725 [Deinococcus sp.]|uniref:hypothetical protein n=1 Tax=Deinococcus sp. TaxID=47478 RepID=UPI0026DCB1C3|nr:hypothetical protein [Deinococcus sp.]MDO4245112.1 hypothetical protein [Deinococcus sp.]